MHPQEADCDQALPPTREPVQLGHRQPRGLGPELGLDPEVPQQAVAWEAHRRQRPEQQRYHPCHPVRLRLALVLVRLSPSMHGALQVVVLDRQLVEVRLEVR